MLKGHVRRDCPNETACYECQKVGHKRGDPECPSTLGRNQEDDFLSTISEIQENAKEGSENEIAENKSVSQMLDVVVTKEPEAKKKNSCPQRR